MDDVPVLFEVLGEFFADFGCGHDWKYTRYLRGASTGIADGGRRGCPLRSEISHWVTYDRGEVQAISDRRACLRSELLGGHRCGDTHASRYSVGSATRFAIDAPRSPFWRESRAKLGALPRVEIERGASTILWTAPHLK